MVKVPRHAREGIVEIGLLGGIGEVSYDDVQIHRCPRRKSFGCGKGHCCRPERNEGYRLPQIPARFFAALRMTGLVSVLPQQRTNKRDVPIPPWNDAF